MAIQIPSVGTGFPADRTGDSPWLATKKIAENFSNQTHAASRLVGTVNKNVPEYTDTTGISGAGYDGIFAKTISWNDISANTGWYKALEASDPINPLGRFASINRVRFSNTVFTDIAVATTGAIDIRVRRYNNEILGEWSKVYTAGNTTIEDGTNYLKVASPILRLQHDDFVKEHEAEQLDIVVTNPEVGVYKITGTTGLRNDGTWHFSPPKDEHNNVLCMVEVSEENDVITVNTYKKKFDFETVSIVPDYEQPTDIPDGATVMLRFNDLPFDESEISEV